MPRSSNGSLLSLFAYVAVVFVVHVPWDGVAVDPRAAPHVRCPQAMALVAVLGTTISPYLFFWQSALEVEDRLRRGALPLCVTPDAARTAVRAHSHRHDGRDGRFQSGGNLHHLRDRGNAERGRDDGHPDFRLKLPRRCARSGRAYLRAVCCRYHRDGAVGGSGVGRVRRLRARRGGEWPRRTRPVAVRKPGRFMPRSPYRR